MTTTEKVQQFFKELYTRTKDASCSAAHKTADQWHRLMDFKGCKRALYKEWHEAAQNGSREAAYKLAMLYFEEEESYYPLAFEWAEKLAREEQDCGVLLQLAQMYENGHGVEQDKQKALSWYERCLSLHIIKGKKSALRVEAANFVQARILALRKDLKI